MSVWASGFWADGLWEDNFWQGLSAGDEVVAAKKKGTTAKRVRELVEVDGVFYDADNREAIHRARLIQAQNEAELRRERELQARRTEIISRLNPDVRKTMGL